MRILRSILRVFLGGKPPKGNPALDAQMAAERAKAEKERFRQEQADADELRARKAGLRGPRSLLTGSAVGFQKPTKLGG